jgi:hypothetical protein
METEELKKLDLTALVDLLAKQTNTYMLMLRNGGPKEEYRQCKELIKLLTKEIEGRRNSTNR